MRRSYLLSFLCLLVAALLFVGSSTLRAASPAPFGLVGEPVTSPDGVRYIHYSGMVPSFDGLPLSVDVTVPADASYPLPLVAMFHGWGQDKQYWQSETISNPNPVVDGWNNVAFASQGYAVLNYTIRGWHDSCGPDRALDPADPSTLPEACTSREYWIHLADPRYEIRDAQHLIGQLVDQGIVHPARIGVTGQSYGGGHSLLLALLNDRTVNLDGSYSEWRSPNGTPLRIAASIPQYTWSSLTHSLLPNGRASDRISGSAATFKEPVGVPLYSYVSGLYASGPVLRNGFYSPPGVDPSSDLTSWYGRITAGNPFVNDPAIDPLLHRALRELDRRSPLYLTPSGRVPIYQIQGLTDPLFPPVEALMMRNRLLAWDAKYPVKSFFGDIGHSNANNPADQWAVAHREGHAFFDLYLKRQGRGPRPAFDVTAMTTTCLPGQSRVTISGASWQALAPATRHFSSGHSQVTSNLAAGLEGAEVDPIVNGGCLSAPVVTGSGVAAWNFLLPEGFTLVGQPTLTLELSATGHDSELNVRLWDVAPDGQSQTLVSRGTYRHIASIGSASRLSFQISANAWQFQPGHTLRVEVVGNDSPTYQASNVPSVITISQMELSLPVTGETP